MLLQPRKLIPKPASTPLTNQLPVQKPLSSRMPSYIPLLQRHILHLHKEIRRETVIMLPMPHTLAKAICADDVDVQMCH